MGHDGTMYLDSKASLVPSDRIVMEVGFDKDIPSSNLLYFRGSILYVDKTDHWEPMPRYVKRENKVYYETKGQQVDYKVTLYPTQKKWVYLLDMPSMTVKKATLDRDLISTLKKPIKEPLHYAASSSLSPRFHDILDKHTLKMSSSFSKEQNPKTYVEAQKLKAEFPSEEKRAKAIVKFFQAQSLTYSLKPKPLDINHTTDSFLFDKHEGYCVHFASSFVTMARMSGIPSRIVTGYKADLANSMKNYLAVKEKDAHAWAELYIDEHWVRFETTTTATSIDAQSQVSLTQDNQSQLSKTINLYLMYAKYQVETWILYYSNIRQLQLLQYAKDNPKFIFTFVVSLLTLIVLTFIVIAYFRRPTYSSEALTLLQPLLKALKKEGYTREKEETLHQYLLRYILENPQKTTIYEVDKCYEQISYAGDTSKETKKELKLLVRKSIASL